MEIKLRIGDSLEVTGDGTDTKAFFRQVSDVGWLFGRHTCGNCGSNSSCPKFRKVREYDYYSIECTECRYELKLGMRKEDGSFFPKKWEAPFQRDEVRDDSRAEAPTF